ncbi:DNA-binding protein [Escherichia coli]|uniref:DNA-binding protein n=1 Tax=Escherichia coli TaxID=562 RepID=UPI000CFE2763
MFVSVNELVGLPGMPGSAQGVRYAIKKLASSEHLRRKRAGTKAIEYHIDCLPEITQKALRERYVEQLVAKENDVSEVKAVVRKTRNPDAVQAIEAYRGSPQLMEERLNTLTENQRRVSEARAALVVEVLKLESDGNLGRLKAINYLVEKARKGELPERLQQATATANAKRGANRTISRDPLYQWVLKYNQSQNAAERLLLLAPGKRDEIKPEEISWLPEFLAQYRQANGRSMSEAYEDFVAEWQRRHADEPYMIEVMPSYDVVRYAMKKLPEVVKQKGRVTGSEYRQLEGFTRRDWAAMPVNYVWIGDGHGMKLKCAHPIHGRPFSPEVTFVIDGGTRFVVGWSLDLAENVFAVAGAIQHGIRNHGKPFLYYSDNGSGETADMLDKEVVGILPRLGIKHPTGIAGKGIMKDAAYAAQDFTSAMQALETSWKKFSHNQLAKPVQDLADAINSVDQNTVQNWLQVGKYMAIALGGIIAIRKTYQFGKTIHGIMNPKGKGKGIPGGITDVFGSGVMPVYVVNMGSGGMNGNTGGLPDAPDSSRNPRKSRNSRGPKTPALVTPQTASGFNLLDMVLSAFPKNKEEADALIARVQENNNRPTVWTDIKNWFNSLEKKNIADPRPWAGMQPTQNYPFLPQQLQGEIRVVVEGDARVKSVRVDQPGVRLSAQAGVTSVEQG